MPISDLQVVASPTSGLSEISGIMTNNSHRTSGDVFVTFALFDPVGTQLGVALANTKGLEPGQSWRMRALSPYPNVARVKVIDVKVY
ncbi:hypothetical protein D9X30_1688 (plasmid) [Cupriavidus sp. U2]|nr:hypothetical protein D9X30_1688 [Cupriavidus sp. U2]